MGNRETVPDTPVFVLVRIQSRLCSCELQLCAKYDPVQQHAAWLSDGTAPPLSARRSPGQRRSLFGSASRRKMHHPGTRETPAKGVTPTEGFYRVPSPRPPLFPWFPRPPSHVPQGCFERRPEAEWSRQASDTETLSVYCLPPANNLARSSDVEMHDFRINPPLNLKTFYNGWLFL